MWNKGLAPSTWCLDLIKPIHKKSPKNDPDSYQRDMHYKCPFEINMHNDVQLVSNEEQEPTIYSQYW